MNPDPLAHALRGNLHLDAALHAVEVRLHVRGVAADVLPVTRGDPAVYALAFLQQLRKHIARPVGDLAGAEEVEDGRVEDVDARVGQVRDDLSPRRLLDEALHRSALVDHHHSVLERIRHRLQHDGRERLALTMEPRGRGQVDVSQGVAGDDDERLGQELARKHHRTRGAQRRVLDRVRQSDALLGTIAEVVANRRAQVLHRRHHVAHLMPAQVQKDVLHDRPPRHGHERLRLATRQGSEARPFPSGHDDRFHVVAFPSLTIVSPCRTI